jgi:hypothetical protein
MIGLEKKKMNGLSTKFLSVNLKIGHGTPDTPILPPVLKSSALPLNSRITLPVRTSKIFRTTLYSYKKSKTLVRHVNMWTQNKYMTVSYICLSRVTGISTAICDQIPLTGREIDQFQLSKANVSSNNIKHCTIYS